MLLIFGPSLLTEDIQIWTAIQKCEENTKFLHCIYKFLLSYI